MQRIHTRTHLSQVLQPRGPSTRRSRERNREAHGAVRRGASTGGGTSSKQGKDWTGDKAREHTAHSKQQQHVLRWLAHLVAKGDLLANPQLRLQRSQDAGMALTSKQTTGQNSC